MKQIYLAFSPSFTWCSVKTMNLCVLKLEITDLVMFNQTGADNYQGDIEKITCDKTGVQIQYIYESWSRRWSESPSAQLVTWL